MSGSLLRVLVLIMTAVTIGVNVMANALPFNGLYTAEISDRYKVFFVPAGYVFSIWGVIYIGMIVYSIFQALPAQKKNKLLDKIAPWYIVSCLANSVWIFLWHYENINLTVPVMLVLLVSLIVCYQLIVSAKTAALSVKLPFSIYLGWISVATIANITAFLDSVKWDGFGLAPQIWAAIMIVVAGALAGVFVARYRDLAFACVIIWAIVGILVKFNDVSVIRYTVLAVSILLICLMGYSKAISKTSGKKK